MKNGKAATRGDVPLYCRALDCNASDIVRLLATVEALAEQLRGAEAEGAEETPVVVAHEQVIRLLGPYCKKLYGLSA